MMEKFLLSLLGSGGVGTALYFFYEKVPYVDNWFADLGRKQKRLIVMLSSLVIPVLAACAGLAFGYLEPNEDLIILAMSAGMGAYLSSQLIQARDL